LFAYLVPNARYFVPAMKALTQSGASVLAYVPGVSAHTVQTYSSATVSISAVPYAMQEIRATCDGAVTQAGFGTSSAILLAGRPQILIPDTSERLMVSKRIESLGAGFVVSPDASASAYAKAVKRLVSDATLAAGALAVASARRDFDPAAVMATIAKQCHELITRRST
jgi:UDP:flavonoid glycosyltransferase YjiC (YdhE family)